MRSACGSLSGHLLHLHKGARPDFPARGLLLAVVAAVRGRSGRETIRGRKCLWLFFRVLEFPHYEKTQRVPCGREHPLYRYPRI